MNHKFDEVTKGMAQVRPSAASSVVCAGLDEILRSGHGEPPAARPGQCEVAGQGCLAAIARTRRPGAAFPPEDKFASPIAPARAFRAQGSFKDGAQDFLAAFTAHAAVPEGARVLEVPQGHRDEFCRVTIGEIGTLGRRKIHFLFDKLV